MPADSFGQYVYTHFVTALAAFAGAAIFSLALYWVFAVPLNSAMTGWVTLGDNYRFRGPPGKSLPGFVNVGATWGGRYSPPVMFAVSKEGLYLWTYWVYRFLQPAVLVPWKDITAIKDLPRAFSKQHGAWNLVTKQDIKIYMNDEAFAAAKPFLGHLGPAASRK